MAVRMTKDWRALSPDNVAGLTGHLGVYQLADKSGEIVYIGVAGGRSRFGIKGEIQNHLNAPPGGATAFRVEINMAYRTRHLELLEVFMHDYGRLPSENTDVDAASLGRLRPYG